MENKNYLKQFIEKSCYIFKCNILQYLTYEELVKFSLTCKQINDVIDPNRKFIDTDGYLNIKYKNEENQFKLENHLSQIAAI